MDQDKTLKKLTEDSHLVELAKKISSRRRRNPLNDDGSDYRRRCNPLNEEDPPHYRTCNPLNEETP